MPPKTKAKAQNKFLLLFDSKSVAATLTIVDLKSFSLNGVLLNKSLALSKVSSCSIALFLTSKANKLSRKTLFCSALCNVLSCSIALFLASKANKLSKNTFFFSALCNVLSCSNFRFSCSSLNKSFTKEILSFLPFIRLFNH